MRSRKTSQRTAGELFLPRLIRKSLFVRLCQLTSACPRYKMFPGFMDRYYGSQNEKATIAYAEIAKKKGLTPTQVRVV